MEKKTARNQIDMTSGPILGKMLQFAFPLMCSSVLQLLFNAADVIVVGRFAGDHSLAAVGSVGSLVDASCANPQSGIAAARTRRGFRFIGPHSTIFPRQVQSTFFPNVPLADFSNICPGFRVE